MRYCIISADDVGQIDFSQIRETSPETLRYSDDLSMTFVKFEGDIPPSIQALDYDGPYEHSEMLEILAGPEWHPE